MHLTWNSYFTCEEKRLRGKVSYGSVCSYAGVGVEHGQRSTSTIFVHTPHLTFGHRIIQWGLGLNCSSRLADQQAPRDLSVSNSKFIVPYVICSATHTDFYMDVEKLVRQALLPTKPSQAVPLSTLSVPLLTCRSAADRACNSSGSTQVNKERPGESEGSWWSLCFKEPKEGATPQLKTQQSTELWRSSLTQTDKDYKLEKHLLWLKNFSNLKQTPPQTYKFKKFIQTG